MGVVDTKKLQTAILYLQRITEGNNPVNNMPVEEDAVLNNPNVKRCMLFVKEVLEEVKRNDGYIGKRPRTNSDNTKLDYPLEALEAFQYTDDKPISKLVDQMNGLADLTMYKKITYRPIVAWLKKNGYLSEEQITGTGRKRTLLTPKGAEIGIKSEMRKNDREGEYVFIIYGRSAQEFIISKMKDILVQEQEEKSV